MLLYLLWSLFNFLQIIKLSAFTAYLNKQKTVTFSIPALSITNVNKTVHSRQYQPLFFYDRWNFKLSWFIFEHVLYSGYTKNYTIWRKGFNLMPIQRSKYFREKHSIIRYYLLPNKCIDKHNNYYSYFHQ